MKFYIKQKFFTLVREQFNIIDENEVPHFTGQGQAFWGGKRITISDTQGNVLFTLKRRLLRLFITIDILNVQGEQLAQFKSRFHMGFTKKYRILSATGTEYSVLENWLGTDYAVNRLQNGIVEDKKGNQSEGIVEVPIAHVSKKFLQFGDRYLVDIADDSETLMSLAIILCVDMARHTRANRNNN